MNWDAFRPGQASACVLCLERLRTREPYTALVLPTRYGKSDAMRVTSYLAWREGLAACTLALSPNAVLRDQLRDQKKWNTAIGRYGLDAAGVRVAAIPTVPTAFPGGRVNFAPNGEMFLSATIQLVQRNLDWFALWAEHLLYRTGLPLVVHVDECHMGGEGLEWGEVTKALVRAGALVVLWTATALRSDGRRIPGFEFETLDEQTVKVRQFRPGSKPELVRVDVYCGVQTRLRLKAHHETTFQEAWMEQPSPLCKVGRVPFDVDLTRIGGGADGACLLSELSATESSRAIGRAVRSRQVIRDGVQNMVRELKRFRGTLPNAGAIVFCGNDVADGEDTGVNGHARAIRAAIEEVAPELNAVIATSADDGSKGETVIKQFVAGLGDVLIVKQMAGVGLDAERLKVCLDLSPVRKPAAFVQRLMRIATPTAGARHCIYICPDDIVGRALFEDLVSGQGGSMSGNALDLIESYETERKEPKELTFYGVNGTAHSEFDDSAGNHGERDELESVQLLLDRVPSLTLLVSHAELAVSLRDLSVALKSGTSEALVEDVSVTESILRADINALADEVTQRRLGNSYSPNRRTEWVEIHRDTYIRAYQAAGIPPGVRLEDIRLLEGLRGVKEALEAMVREVGAR